MRMVVYSILIAMAFISLSLVCLGLNGEISGLRANIQQQTTQASQQQAKASRELSAAQSDLSKAQQRIGGTHRDLITCADFGDFQKQFSVQGSDSAGVTVYSSPLGQPWYPPHCLNQ